MSRYFFAVRIKTANFAACRNQLLTLWNHRIKL